MRKILKILIIGLLIVIDGCASITETYIDHNPYRIRKRINLHKKQDTERLDQITNCSEAWKFNYLDTTINLTIIQYHPAYRFDLISQPALIIGLRNQDTIRILCYDYFDKLNKHQIIRVYPDSTVDLKDPLFYRDIPLFLSKNKHKDKYFCDIKKTYIGKIK